jgi:hypothetical protein
MIKVELLYFEGCPHHRPTEQLLRETISELGVETDIEVVKVVDNDGAQANRFLGSPSIRVDGRDLEQTEDETTKLSMRCRLYRSTRGMSGVPSKNMIVAAIQTVLDKKA